MVGVLTSGRARAAALALLCAGALAAPATAPAATVSVRADPTQLASGSTPSFANNQVYYRAGRGERNGLRLLLTQDATALSAAVAPAQRSRFMSSSTDRARRIGGSGLKARGRRPARRRGGALVEHLSTGPVPRHRAPRSAPTHETCPPAGRASPAAPPSSLRC